MSWVILPLPPPLHPPPSLATQEAAAGVIIRSTEGSKIGMLEMKLSHYLKSIMSFSISPCLHLLNMRLIWPMLSHESSPRHQQPISQQHTYTRQVARPQSCQRILGRLQETPLQPHNAMQCYHYHPHHVSESWSAETSLRQTQKYFQSSLIFIVSA